MRGYFSLQPTSAAVEIRKRWKRYMVHQKWFKFYLVKTKDHPFQVQMLLIGYHFVRGLPNCIKDKTYFGKILVHPKAKWYLINNDRISSYELFIHQNHISTLHSTSYLVPNPKEDHMKSNPASNLLTCNLSYILQT